MVDTVRRIPRKITEFEQTIADLRRQLDEAISARDAALTARAELEARVTDAEGRIAALTLELSQAGDRVHALAKLAVEKPITLPPMPEPQPPVSYEASVTQRDVEGKIKTVTLTPRGLQ